VISARGSRRARDAIASLLLGACAPLEDRVFHPIELEPSEPVLVQEGALTIEIPVMLDHVPSEAVSLGYELVPGEAQNDCPEPDFEAAAGQVRFEAFATVALVPVFIGDDELAETDESFELRVGDLAPVTIRILDDDRGALLDAASFGVVPGTTADQAPALQAALDEALSVGRGVVVVAPGDYELSSVSVPEGVTLSARGAVFHRPPRSADDLVSLRIEHLGSIDALPSLVEGASFDGRREEQGPYRDSERQDAHLVALQGDGAEGGRATASLERIGLDSGTASGVMVGPDVNVTLCGVRANELWRDAVTVVGGATRMRLRNLDATATEGTGLWIGPRHWGYAEDLSVDAEIEDVRIAAGDVELEATAGSRLDVRRLTMTEPPFRLDAPDGSVRIADSVLMLGIPSETHNFFGVPHDVSLDRTTLVVSERAADNGAPFEEQARTLVGVNVGTASLAAGDGPNLPGTLLFTDCHFELAADVEADDQVFAIDNRNPDVSVSVMNARLGSGFVDLFSDDCVSCTSAP
jgi:hypothetical protein